MNYLGKLYGNVGGNYFDTGRTSEEFDKFEADSKKLSQFKEIECPMCVDYIGKIDKHCGLCEGHGKIIMRPSK